MKLKQLWAALASVIALGNQAAADLDLDLKSPDSIKSAAAAAARGVMKYYNGNEPGQAPGLLNEPYYWGQGAILFNALVDYWHYTEDSTYNKVVKQALLHQVGQNYDFMPANQSRTEGNDDQAFWALTALSAAEYSFDAPGSDEPQWLDLAKAVFDGQVRRWDTKTCDGGLRWQFMPFNQGYDYKNSMANAAFIDLSSRLARYTKNETYSDWAGKAWDWMSETGFITEDFKVFDGADANANCEDINKVQWSLNSGLLLSGSANLYNSTDGDSTWKSRVEGLVKGLDVFFKKDVMIEAACEMNHKCNIDQKGFKAILSRALATTVQLAPFTKDSLLPKIQASAKAAADECDDDDDDDDVASCSFYWTDDDDDDDDDETLGEGVAALQIIQVNLMDQVSAPGKQDSPSGGGSDGGTGGSGTPTSSVPPSGSPTGAASSVMTLGIHQWASILLLTGLSAMIG
ncbi:hypothetical protein FQN50_005647 [Emmonsiellopsis sp. PD_5]|nr:hypothetical protein FQN50_005647 [Emmonsiellopsis sp. PD_5]